MLGLVLRLKEMVSRVRARDAGAQGRFATPGLVPNRLNQSQALPASVANQCSFNTKDSSILVLTYTLFFYTNSTHLVSLVLSKSYSSNKKECITNV